MTLTSEQTDYVRDLAFQAAHGAWATDRQVSIDSRAFLHDTLPCELEPGLVLRLVELAACDPDHNWEALTLTVRPVEYAESILEILRTNNA